jgi:2-polyprenyl-6-hydroxyphenyl methylase/3-demethylubiquinone-9 3-methyltransferase
MLSDPEHDRRFAFGDNWLDFARDLSGSQIAEAEKSLRALLRCDSLAGLRFVDVGSGSGLFSLAARRLGARVHSFDFDQASVLCTRRLRDLHFPNDADWSVEQGSILDRDYVSRLGTFDVVYSWGVLHHTGAMQAAIEAAASLVAPSGLFAFALYRRTLICGLWRIEKRWYSGASPEMQRRARAIYVALMRAAFRLTGRDFHAYVATYQGTRGMSFSNDVHDWMGGYPYESISAASVAAFMQRCGFVHMHSKVSGISSGVFGSGCNEYLYRRAR